MSRIPIGLLIAIVVFFQSGCRTPGRWRKSRASADADIVAKARRPLQRVGVVALVNQADGFVLIDSGSLPIPAVGARLVSYTGAAASGQLKASAVRRRPFLVADILDGTPRTGDEIFEAPTAPAAAVKP